MNDVREGGRDLKITFEGKRVTGAELIEKLQALSSLIQKIPNPGIARLDELQANLKAMATALETSNSPTSEIMQEAKKLLVETLLEANSLVKGHEQELATFFPDQALPNRYPEEMDIPGGFG